MAISGSAGSTGGGTASQQFALEISGASKRFGQALVLDNVSLRLRTGEVCALLGANGSGKSTLIKGLAGYHAFDSGRVAVHGTELSHSDMGRQGREAGLRFVHQELALIPDQSVMDNLAYERGYVRGRAGSIQWRAELARVQADLGRVGLADVDPRAEIRTLGPVERTLIAIARALDRIDAGSNILVLDEPTARLPNEEAARLVETLTRLKSAGLPVIYISHRLEEVADFADHVVVLRDGKTVFAGPMSRTSVDGLRSLIAGIDDAGPPAGAADRAAPEPPTVLAAPRASRGVRTAGAALELRNVSSKRLRSIDLTVGRSEVVAVTGLVGSGRSELGRVVYGVQPYTSGEVVIAGSLARRPQTTAYLAENVGYLPQERSASVLAGLTIEDNIIAASYSELSRWYGLASDKTRAVTIDMINLLQIRPPDPKAPASRLSGGNQQKVVLARWLRLPLALLILDEPTQSIDVAAKEDLMTAIRRRADETGLGVLWIEADIEEVVKYADRVIVMSEGQITTEFDSPPFTVSETLAAAYGSGKKG